MVFVESQFLVCIFSVYWNSIRCTERPSRQISKRAKYRREQRTVSHHTHTKTDVHTREQRENSVCWTQQQSNPTAITKSTDWIGNRNGMREIRIAACSVRARSLSLPLSLFRSLPLSRVGRRVFANKAKEATRKLRNKAMDASSERTHTHITQPFNGHYKTRSTLNGYNELKQKPRPSDLDICSFSTIDFRMAEQSRSGA